MVVTTHGRFKAIPLLSGVASMLAGTPIPSGPGPIVTTDMAGLQTRSRTGRKFRSKENRL